METIGISKASDGLATKWIQGVLPWATIGLQLSGIGLHQPLVMDALYILDLMHYRQQAQSGYVLIPLGAGTALQFVLL